MQVAQGSRTSFLNFNRKRKRKSAKTDLVTLVFSSVGQELPLYENRVDTVSKSLMEEITIVSFTKILERQNVNITWLHLFYLLQEKTLRKHV